MPLLLAALVALAAGCSSPKPIRTYEEVYLYDRMSGDYEPLLSLVYMPDKARFYDCETFYIGNVRVSSNWVKEDAEALRYAMFFRNILRRELARTGKFPHVTLDAPAGDAPAFRLEASVTRFKSGSGLLRFLSPYLFFLASSGATDFQIEGRILMQPSEELVMEFVDRRRDLGNTLWGPNPKTFADEFVMKRTVALTARCLAKFIDIAYYGMPAVSGEAQGGEGLGG